MEKKDKQTKTNRIVIEEIDESRLKTVTAGAGPNDQSGQDSSSCQCVCGGIDQKY